jgi:hypothetical protein
MTRIPQFAKRRYTDEEITPMLFDSYAEYLFNLTYPDPKNDGKETHYASGSALQYYSDAMTVLKGAYPDLPLWTDKYDPKYKGPEWYFTTRKQLKFYFANRIMELGEKLQPGKSLPIGRALLLEMLKACEVLGSIENGKWAKKSIEMRYCFITQYLVGGR